MTGIMSSFTGYVDVGRAQTMLILNTEEKIP